MGNIQSNSGVASTHATSIMMGANGISNVGEVTKDSSSDYPGNTTASDKIDKDASVGAQIASKATEFIGLINSVASEFEAVDAAISSSISSGGSTDTDFTPDQSLFAE